MNEQMQIDFVVEGEALWSVKSYAVPEVGEVIQIRGVDYTVTKRYWAIDNVDTWSVRALRAIVGLAPE